MLSDRCCGKSTVRRIAQSAIYLGVVAACTTVSVRHCPDCHLFGERGAAFVSFVYSNWYKVHCTLSLLNTRLDALMKNKLHSRLQIKIHF